MCDFKKVCIRLNFFVGYHNEKIIGTIEPNSKHHKEASEEETEKNKSIEVCVKSK